MKTATKENARYYIRIEVIGLRQAKLIANFARLVHSNEVHISDAPDGKDCLKLEAYEDWRFV